MVYLGGNFRKHNKEVGNMRQRTEKRPGKSGSYHCRLLRLHPMGDLLGECGSTTQVSQTQGGAAEASVHQLTSSSNEDCPGSPGSPRFGGAPLKVKISWHGARERP